MDASKLSKLRALIAPYLIRSDPSGQLAGRVSAILDSPEPDARECTTCGACVISDSWPGAKFAPEAEPVAPSREDVDEPYLLRMRESDELESLNKLWGKLHKEMTQERNVAQEKAESLRAENARLAAELATAREDAERWRYWREHFGRAFLLLPANDYTTDKADAAIDAARSPK